MAVETALRRLPYPHLQWRTAQPATPANLLAIHTQKHIDAILQPIAPGTTRHYPPDTDATAGTASAIRAAAGLALQAVADVVSGKHQSAFCLCSPGGHHAEVEMASGFCFVNHVALAAVYAQQMGMKRVAVVDIDVHHGNGTQAMFWNYPERLFISLHESASPTGHTHETGCAENILNIPLPPRTGGGKYIEILKHTVLEKLHAFAPDMLFVSAGLDAHQSDPLGNLFLATDDYKTIGSILASAAMTLCNGRLVSILEGGYNLSTLGNAAAAYITGIIEAQS
ncbi:MAG: histone deacetylase family protein [Alphaproteobacteria bacterium]|nr:histone deacetylase family protein [Alphaproteobacteria bacterium]